MKRRDFLKYTAMVPVIAPLSLRASTSDKLNNVNTHNVIPLTNNVNNIRNLKNDISTIMGTFDFNKVHTAMKALEWKWCDNGKMKVPTLDEIKMTVHKHLLHVSSYPKGCTIYSGGFEVSHQLDCLYVDFKLESCDTFIDKEV